LAAAWPFASAVPASSAGRDDREAVLEEVCFGGRLVVGMVLDMTVITGR
jgi:hypothetical protein